MNERLALYPTMITPFNADLSVDVESLERLIALFASCHCDGVFAVCQSSEMFYLRDDEKLHLAAVCLQLARKHHMKCVVSGHTQESVEEQILYLKQLEQLQSDAIILVSNRLAREEEDDDVLLANLGHILNALSPDTRLGVYECPYPYKRLISPAVLTFMRDSGRFDFLKDTCCRIQTIRERLLLLENSPLKLYNANAATLLESCRAGAAGYSGVMLNMMPEIFSLLKKHSFPYEWPAGTVRPYDKRMVEAIAECISLMSVVEYQNYPVNAKYVLQRRGVIRNTLSRNGSPPLTESQKGEMEAFLNHVRREASRLEGRVGYNRDLREALFPEGCYFDSCHASTVLPLADGTVLAAFFAGTEEGAQDVGIWLSRRRKETWQPPVLIAKMDQTAHWNPVLFCMDKTIHLVFKVGKDVPSWQSWTLTSGDQGETWSAPTPLGGAVGPVRSKPLLLSDGRLLAPNSCETVNQWTCCVDEAIDGTGFRFLASIPVNTENPEAPHFLNGRGAIQPTLWERSPGKVHALLRTTGGAIFRSDSEDGGCTWCLAYDTGLPGNNSGIEVVQQGTVLYLLSNPVSGDWGVRYPLVVQRSVDNGRTFQLFATLENASCDDRTGASAEFSYPAAVVCENTLHLTYTWNRRQIVYCRIQLPPPDEGQMLP